MKEYDFGLAETLIMVKEKRNIVNPNKSFIKQLEVYEGILGAIRHRHTYFGLFRSKSESSLVPTSPCSQLEDLSPPPSTPTARRGIAESINIDIKALSTVFNQSPARPNSEPIFCNRPKSWSPNDQTAGLLLRRERQRGHDKNTDQKDQQEEEDCQCFGELIQNNYSSSPSSSSQVQLSSSLKTGSGEASFIEARNSSLIASTPVNSKTVTLYNPNCPCDIELELGVPEDPIVLEEKSPNLQTDKVVHNLSNLSLQMRTNSQHLDGFQPSPSSAGTPAEQRRSSVDRHLIDKPPLDPENIILDEIAPQRTQKEEELSVKTLANMFDFKTCSAPIRPCSARLEDSHLFQKAAKSLATSTVAQPNNVKMTQLHNESETTQSDC